MSEPRIFVSYSHADSEHLEHLQKHLEPFARRDMLELWTDRALKEGEDWRVEIEDAIESADVAVLLISADFLASSFITDVEIPRFLARHERGEVTLIPVFLSPSSVDAVPYSFEDGEGERHEVFLTRFQGIASHGKPVLDLQWSDRERCYVKLAKRLTELTGSAPPVRRSTVRADGLHGDAVDLTVSLELKGDGLRISYFKEQLGKFETRQVPSIDLEARLKEWSTPFDDFKPTRLQAWFKQESGHVGQALFQTLFGEQHASIFRRVFSRGPGDLDPAPWFHGVRLRLVSPDPRLLGLPWSFLTYRGRRLIDEQWTVSVGSEQDPDQAPTTEPLDEVLILTSSQGPASQSPGGDQHVQRVQDLLGEAWGERAKEHIRVISDVHTLRRSAPGLRPHLVYVHAQGSTDGLLLDDGPVSSRELAELLVTPASSPRAVIFACGNLGHARRVPFDDLVPHVPLVLWRRWPDWTPGSEGALLSWLGRWLRSGQDPVEALADLVRDADSLDASSLALHADYRTWTTETSTVVSKGKDAQFHLDRLDQKSRAIFEVEGLMRGDLTVLALVAHAAPGYGAELAARQLTLATESRFGRNTPVERVEVEIPDARRALKDGLPRVLDEYLDRIDGESVLQMLRRKGPTLLMPGQKGVLWLDWQTYGHADSERERLAFEDLKDWLCFTHDFLPAHCPPELRIVSFLSLEVPKDEMGALEDFLDDLDEILRLEGRRFRYVHLGALGRVPYRELKDFLRDHTSCPPGSRVDVAKAIHRRTDGRFNETVQWILDAERVGWATVLAQLNEDGGTT